MIALAIVAALLFATNTEAQSIEVSFYFAPSEYVLTDAQQDSIESFLNSNPNLVVVEVIGYANTLPNYNGMSNTDLALARAEEIAGWVDFAPSGISVAGTTANDRKVTVVFEVSQDETVETVISNEQSVADADQALVDSMLAAHSNRQVIVITDANGVVGILADSTDAICFDVNYTDTVAYTSYEEAIFAMPIPSINESPSCGCGVNNSLEQTWALYKSYQDSASLFTHVDNDARNKYTVFATQTRMCWEAMYKAFKQQENQPMANGKNPLAVKSSLKAEVPARTKAKSTKKSHKARKVRKAKRTWRPNDSVWSKIFPFRAC